MEKEFILGVNNITGWAAYVLPDTTLIKRYVHDETSCYPNHDCSYRTRVSGCFAELDSFSPSISLSRERGFAMWTTCLCLPHGTA